MENTAEDKFPYGKDNKERLPWEHYLSLYEKADPQEIAQRLRIVYDEAANPSANCLLISSIIICGVIPLSLRISNGFSLSHSRIFSSQLSVS